MSSAVISLELPEPLLAFATEEASRHGTSIEDWLRDDLAYRFQLHKETEEFFRIRRERAIPGAFQALLDRVPNNPPDPGDELDLREEVDPTAWKDLLARVPQVPPMPGDELE